MEEGNRVRIGFLYELEIPTLDPGHEFAPKDPKIARIQPFGLNQVITMLKDEKVLHKPEFNRESILYWTQRQFLPREFGSYDRLRTIENARATLKEMGLDRNPNIVGITPLFPEEEF